MNQPLTKKDFNEGCKRLRRAVRDTLNKKKAQKKKKTQRSSKKKRSIQKQPLEVKPFKKVVKFTAKVNKRH